MVKKSFGIKIFSVMMSAALAFTLVACSQEEAVEEQDTSFEVQASAPIVRDIEVEGDFIGRVEADSQVMIIPKLAGDVTGVFFNVGDHVEAGDLLFTMDDSALKIQLSQAQAGLDSASAAVNTAQANVGLNEYNLIYTQAQINQNLGSAESNRMQLANAVASAKRAVEAANGNIDLAAEQLKVAEDAYDSLDDNIDKLMDAADKQEGYADSLGQISAQAAQIAKLSNEEARAALGLDPLTATETANDCANMFISNATGGSAKNQTELSAMIKTASSGALELEAQGESLENNRGQLRLAKLQAAMGVEVAQNNALSAEEGALLAERMLADFENYTMATLLAGAQYQMEGARVQAQGAQSSLTQANSAVRQAKAGVDSVKLQMGYANVKSPVSGTVTAKNVTVNNMATQSQPAFVITSDNKESISFNVAQTVMEVIEVGDTIVVERNGKSYNGTVIENTGIYDAQTGLFKIKATLDGEETGVLVPGTSVKISLVTQRVKGALCLPIDCIYYENHTPYVYTEKNGVAVKTVIETGISDNEFIEVLSGLDSSSKVITTWHSRLADGSKVKVKK